MLAESKHIQPCLVGQGNLFHQIAEALRWANPASRVLLQL
jgi:hypothetical protein